ncbi:RecT family recombinase [Blastopirellula marina]|nr:RecT family recombinase [Blastopirellula marina]
MTEQKLPAPSALDQALGFRTVSIAELNDEQKKVLKETVAKDASDTELAYFLNVSLAHNLNPFNKEVWFIKYGGKVTIQTGRDGFLQIAKRDPTFDRITSAEVRAKDHFVFDPVSGDIEHRINAANDRGDIIGAYAIITRKDGVKIAKYVTWSEYNGTSEIWKKNKSAMICKCAESILCKQFANVTGIQSSEAMPTEGMAVDNSPEAAEASADLKQHLIDQIEACNTIEEVDAFAQTAAVKAGQLFSGEADEVKAAAAKKRQELKQPVLDGDIRDEQEEKQAEEPKPEPKAEDEKEPKVKKTATETQVKRPQSEQGSMPLAA